MRYWLFLFLIADGALAAQPAQSASCYQAMRQEGVDMMQKKNYKNAINQFWTTLVVCKDKPPKDDLNDLIREAQQRWVSDLENAVAREQAAYREAMAAREAAENAKTAEEKARKEAEANAKKAREQGIKAESLRLALLADMARERGRKSDALILSWMALQLSGPDLPPHVMRAFGEAVRDTFGRSFFNSPQVVQSAQLLPGGQKLLIKTADGNYFIIGSGVQAGVTQLPPGLVEVVPSSLGAFLLAWGRDNTARLLNQEGAVVATLTGHTEAIRFATFSPDDSRILTCSRDNTARLWTTAGKPVAVLEGHSANVQNGSFAADGSFLLTRAADGTARTWTPEGQPLATFGAEQDYLTKALIIPQKNWVATLSGTGKCRVVDMHGRSVYDVPATEERVKDIVTAANASRLAIRTGDQNISLTDLAGGTPAICRHPVAIAGLSLNPDGSRMLTWAKDHVVRLWDDRGHLLREFHGHRGEVTSAMFSPDGSCILTTSLDETVKLWDPEGNVLTEWALGSRPLAHAFFASDGNSFFVTNNDCKSVSSTPLPLEVYRKVAPNAVLQAPATFRLLREYNVQYAEELSANR